MYWKVLENYTDDECKSAFDNAISKCKFFPKPVELIEFINEDINPIGIEARAEQQWRVILSTLGRGPFDDPVTAHLCKRQFNNAYLRNMLEKDENWEQKRFCRSYELAAEAFETDPQIEQMPNEVKQLVGGIFQNYIDPREKRITQLRAQGAIIQNEDNN